ncbi:YceI family protein [Flavobacteriaceae bacterium]|nr:YceI family protein [Flavobacteriaceae bacterium]
MKKFTFIFILFTNILSSQEILRIDNSTSSISYSGKHFLHSWDAKNENISGLIELKENQISKIGVIAKVADFKSGNSSLDSNSFRVLDALKIPNIIFRSTDIVETLDIISVYGTISFHGVEKAINVTLNKSNDNDIVSLNGKFIIKLSDFNVKRPSLLLQKINDEIEVQINLIFN